MCGFPKGLYLLSATVFENLTKPQQVITTLELQSVDLQLRYRSCSLSHIYWSYLGFNLSVLLCKQQLFVRQVIAKTKDLDWKKYKRLGDLHSNLGLTLSDMIQLVNESLHKEPYSKQEVCEILEVTEEELNSLSLSERTYDSK